MIVGVLICSTCATYVLFRIFDTSPVLVVDADGIIDNSSWISVGRVPWSEIRGLKVLTVGKQDFLTIEIFDPEKYIQRPGYTKLLFRNQNIKRYGSPIQ